MKEETEKRDCAFQFASAPSLGGVKIYEDKTELTLSEAKELYRANLDNFIRDLKNEMNPEMCIWINMTDKYAYGETLVHLDRDWELDKHGRLYLPKKEYAPEI